MPEQLPDPWTNSDADFDEEDYSEYQVGYARPPKSGQFKKGQSGNKRGRPKGSKSFAAIVRAGLLKKVNVKVDGKQQSLTVGEAVVTRTLRAAAAGEKRATDHSLRLMERYNDPDPSTTGSGFQGDLSLLTDAEVDELSRLLSKAQGEEESFHAEEAKSRQEGVAR